MIHSAETIYVELLEEGVRVWRPVPAENLGGSFYRIGNEHRPEEFAEVWRFPTGTIVRCDTQDTPDGIRLVAREAVDCLPTEL